MEISIKKKHLIILGLAIAISLSVIALRGTMAEQSAKRGDTVGVDYWLTVEGEQIDTSEGRGVFEFALGTGAVIPGFDKAVTGMKIGEEKTVTLSGADAYTAGPLAGKTLNFRIILRDIQ